MVFVCCEFILVMVTHGIVLCYVLFFIGVVCFGFLFIVGCVRFCFLSIGGYFFVVFGGFRSVRIFF